MFSDNPPSPKVSLKDLTKECKVKAKRRRTDEDKVPNEAQLVQEARAKNLENENKNMETLEHIIDKVDEKAESIWQDMIFFVKVRECHQFYLSMVQFCGESL